MVDSGAAVAEAKTALRARMRAARRALDPTRRANEAGRVCERIRELLAADRPAALASYLAMPDEVDLAGVHAWWWRSGRPVWLPRVLGPGQLSWHPVGDLRQTRIGAFAIREPDPDLIPPGDLPSAAVVLVPGVAFDDGGGRLGLGGGFYDRVLAGHAGSTIGVAFGCQRAAAVPREAHDRRVGRVIFGD